MPMEMNTLGSIKMFNCLKQCRPSCQIQELELTISLLELWMELLTDSPQPNEKEKDQVTFRLVYGRGSLLIS